MLPASAAGTLQYFQVKLDVHDRSVCCWPVLCGLSCSYWCAASCLPSPSLSAVLTTLLTITRKSRLLRATTWKSQFQCRWVVMDEHQLDIVSFHFFSKWLAACFCTSCSTRNKFLLTQWTEEKFITLSDGKQKMLSTKTLSRKATSCSAKVKALFYSCL